MIKVAPIILLVYFIFFSSLFAETINPPTVGQVDISKYMGTWYQIAFLPTSFQKKCAATKTDYTLLKNGKVEVKNQCKNLLNPQETKVAYGIARVFDKDTNAKLKVSFVPFFKRWGWFSGDYWILALGNNYEYALVGGPTTKYLWILSRTPYLEEVTYVELLGLAESYGYDISKIKKTPPWNDQMVQQ